MDVSGQFPGGHDDRVCPEQLFGRSGDYTGLVGDAFPVGGMRGEVPEHVGQRGGDGVESGEEQQGEQTHQLVICDGTTVDVEVNGCGDDVVPGFASPDVDEVGEVCGELADGVAAGGGPAWVVGLVQDLVFPFQEPWKLLGWESE